MKSSKSHKWPFLAEFILFISSLTLYLLTMPHTIGFGDSGALAAAGVTLGVTHPPGHPGWVLPVWLWSKMFTGGNSALILHIFSALAASAGAVCVARLLANSARLLGFGETPAELRLGWGLMIAVFPPYWRYATSVEVYTLQWLWLAMAFNAAVCFALHGRRRSWIGMWVYAVLAITVHPFSLFFTPIPILTAWYRRASLTPRDLVPALMALALGAASYLLVIWFAQDPSAFRWTLPQNIPEWWSYFSAAEYADRLVEGNKLHIMWEQLGLVLPRFSEAGLWLYPALGFPSALILFGLLKKQRPILLILLSWLLVLSAIPFTSTHLDTSLDWSSYFWVAFLAIILAFGLVLIRSIHEETFSPLSLAPIIPVICVVWLNWQTLQRRDHVFPDFLATIIFMDVARNGLVMVKDDASYFSLLYRQYALDARPDVEVLHLDGIKKHTGAMAAIHPHIRFPEQVPNDDRVLLKAMAALNRTNRPVYWFGHPTFIGTFQPNEVGVHDILYELFPSDAGETASLPFLTYYGGLKPEQRAFYSRDPVMGNLVKMLLNQIYNRQLAGGGPASVQKLLETWWKFHPDDATGLSLRANTMLLQGEPENARKLLDSFEGKWTDQMVLDYCRILAREGGHERLLAFIETHPIEGAGKGHLLRMRVRALGALDKVEQGLREIEEHFETDSPFAQMLTAELQYASGDRSAAITTLKRLLAQGHNNAEIQNLLTQYQMERKQEDQEPTDREMIESQ